MRVPRLRGIGPAVALGVLAVPAAAADPRGALYVVSAFGGIERVDAQTGEHALVADIPSARTRIALDGAGHALVRRSDGAVLRVDLASGDVTPLAEGGFLAAGTTSEGIAVDGQDAIATSTLGRIVRIDPTGDQSLVAEVSFPPHGVAVEADRSILVLSPGRVLRVDPATGDSTTVAQGPPLGNALDLDVLPDGTIGVLQVLSPEALVLVDPVTGVQSIAAMATALEGPIDIDVVTGFAQDADGGFHITTGRHFHDPPLEGPLEGGVVHFVPGGLARAVTAPDAFYDTQDVALPEPGLPLLLAAGASLLLFLRLARR